MAAFDLTDVAAVRKFMGTPSDEHEQDPLIETLISAASKAIINKTGREFAPAIDDEARDFEYRPGSHLLDFENCDARAITSVKDEQGTTIAESYWRPYPVRKRDDVYTGIRLYLPTWYPSYFEHRIVTVTADWGFESVPEPVSQAATLAVALWLRRDVSVFSTTFNIDTQRYERPEELPAAAAGLIASYERGTYA